VGGAARGLAGGQDSLSFGNGRDLHRLRPTSTGRRTDRLRGI